MRARQIGRGLPCARQTTARCGLCVCFQGRSVASLGLSDSAMDIDAQLRQFELDEFISDFSDGAGSPFSATWRSAISDDDLGPSGAASARTRWKRAWSLIKAANRSYSRLPLRAIPT